MERPYPHLFSPLTLKRGFTFKNRIVASPIGNWIFSPENYLFDYAVDHFAEKAIGGAAAVTIGHTEINYGESDSDPFGKYFKLRDDKGRAALAEFAHAITDRGCHVSIQLNYAGRMAHGVPGQTIYAPSAEKRTDGVIVEEMSKAKIKSVIQEYVECARELKKAGFDMCMLHGAHGWLLPQFLSPDYNRRTDEYGGSLRNRMRFPLEVIDAIRNEVGDDFMIEYRIGGRDPVNDPENFGETVAFLQEIQDRVDLIHISCGSPRNDPNFPGLVYPTYLDPMAPNVKYAEAIKAHVTTPIVTVGAIADPDIAEEIIRQGRADFVAMGRPLVADPHLPRKARQGRKEDIFPCLGCHNCLETMHITQYFGCDINPVTGREHRLANPGPAARPRRVVVVGGGPAGMQAAITAADRGHCVTLLEQSDRLGGLLKLTDGDETKYRLNRYKNFLITQVGKRDIDVRLNTEATPDAVEALGADAVLIAVGSEPIVPPIPGADGSHVYTCVTLHGAEAGPGRRVAVIGGNMVGCETAVSLKHTGHEVVLIEMGPKLHADANVVIANSIQKRLDDGVDCRTNTRCVEILPHGVVVQAPDGSRETIAVDSVVLAVGMRAKRKLADSFMDCALLTAPIGDCIKPGTVRQTSRTGYFAALDL